MRDFDNGFNSSVKNNAYEYLGSFLDNGVALFRVWAPSATAVSVVGDFNGWVVGQNPMRKIADGIWEAEIGGIKNFDNYKYAITAPDGSVKFKSDPYARHFETAPANSSKVYADDGYVWNDNDWRDAQKEKNILESPVNIYEVHLGSWRRFEDGTTYDYVTAAKEI